MVVLWRQILLIPKWSLVHLGGASLSLLLVQGLGYCGPTLGFRFRRFFLLSGLDFGFDGLRRLFTGMSPFWTARQMLNKSEKSLLLLQDQPFNASREPGTPGGVQASPRRRPFLSPLRPERRKQGDRGTVRLRLPLAATVLTAKPQPPGRCRALGLRAVCPVWNQASPCPNSAPTACKCPKGPQAPGVS